MKFTGFPAFDCHNNFYFWIESDLLGRNDLFMISNKDNLPILAFKTEKEWEQWLDQHHDSITTGIWLRFYKKGSGQATITYAEALDVALCYGWIDAVINKFDENSYLQKFTPRRVRSLWSKRNIEHAARLIAAERMQPAGLKEIEKAKTDGRWEGAYDSPANMEIPLDFLEALAQDPAADAFFKTLNKTNQYAIGWRLQTARRPETREKRMKVILEMLSKGQKFH